MKKWLFVCSFILVACSNFGAPKESHGIGSAPQVAPLVENQTLTSIAFASCSHQKAPQPIWSSVLNLKPDLYIGMGDNVYASKTPDLPILEQYRLQASIPEFKKFRSQVPVIGTWDDHDYGLGDGGAKNPKRDEAKAAYLQFFPEDRKKIPDSQLGIQHSFVLGQEPRRLHVILLDTRTYRSDLEPNTNPKTPLDKFLPTRDSSKTLLGEEQWRWLEQELKTKAEVHLLVSSIQVIPEQHGFEKWANFPHERKRLFEMIERSKIKNLVILSGDRHFAEISRVLLAHGPLYEITASSLNRPASIQQEKNSHRIGSLYNKENFGWLQIDWEKQQLHFDIRDIHGTRIRTLRQNIKPL